MVLPLLMVAFIVWLMLKGRLTTYAAYATGAP